MWLGTIKWQMVSVNLNYYKVLMVKLGPKGWVNEVELGSRSGGVGWTFNSFDIRDECDWTSGVVLGIESFSGLVQHRMFCTFTCKLQCSMQHVFSSQLPFIDPGSCP